MYSRIMKNAIIVSVLAMSGIVYGETSEKLPGISLTKSNFDHHIAQDNILILFYSPGCELSKKFLPTFSSLADQFNSKNGLKLGSVNCDENKSLCTEKGAADSLQIYLYKTEGERVKFSGVKTNEGLAKFLVKHLGENILDSILEMPEKIEAINELTDESFGDHVAIGQHFIKFYAPWCGHCQRLAPTWDELASALEYDTSVSISKIDCTKYRPICQDYEVKGYPTLLWIVDGKKVEKYTGPRSLDDLKVFVEKSAGVERKIDEQTKEEKPEEGGVLIVTASNFDHSIEKGVTFVKFFAPWCGHCKRMSPTWDELAVKFIGNPRVKIGKVDCTVSENKELCTQQEVDGFPTIFIYRNGQKIATYNGNRSIDDLYEFVTSHLGHDEL